MAQCDMSREEFAAAMVEALRERPDLQKNGENGDTVEKLDAREVADKLCFDFPDVSSSECDALADALLDPSWRQAKRFSYRSAQGIVEYTASRARNENASSRARDGNASRLSEPASRLAGVLGVRVVKALLLMSRFEVLQFASKVFVDDADEVIRYANIRREQREKRPIDYSKWDNVDSDEEEEAEIAARNEAAQVRNAGVPDRTGTRACESVRDAAAFVMECSKTAEYALLSGLDSSASEGALAEWKLIVEDATKLAEICLGTSSSSSSCGWILSRRGDVDTVEESCRSLYERYVFLLRDACLHQPQLRVDLSAKMARLCFSDGGGARSARDGGVALCALGSTAEVVRTPEIRDAATAVLPCVTELVRALAGGKGEGDSMLLGTALALAEAANSIKTTSESGDFVTTIALHGASRAFVESGTLGVLCVLAMRLAAESAAAQCNDGRARTAEIRLHRLLVACAAQSPGVVAPFVVRVPGFPELLIQPAFAERCPVEAALWSARLRLAFAVAPPQRTPPVGLQEHLQNKFAELLAKQTVLAQVVAHLNLTRNDALSWFAQDADANKFFWAARDDLLSTTAATPQSESTQQLTGTSEDTDDGDDKSKQKQVRIALTPSGTALSLNQVTASAHRERTLAKLRSTCHLLLCVIDWTIPRRGIENSSACAA